MKIIIKYAALTGLVFPAAVGYSQAINVSVDGSPVQFSGVGPQSIQGRVFVPLRGVLEKLGAYVEWVPSTRSIVAQRGNIDLELRIGERTARLNGRDVQLDVPATVFRGTTLVPLRFMGEALGADVRWENATRTVLINTGGSDNNNNGNNNNNNNGQTPEITAFRHNADGWVKTGDTLEVILEGTPGGTAYFQIPNVTDRIQMREVGSGRYAGIWNITARAAKNISDASIIGLLRVGGQERLITSGAPISIDTVAPKITTAVPQTNSSVVTNQPNIYVVFDDAGGSGIDPQSVTLLINQQNVTNEATVSNAFVNYRPANPLTAGENTVSLSAQDKAGNPVNMTWKFRVTDRSTVIRSFTHTANSQLGPGDVFTVRLEGEQNGKASFSVGNVKNIPMREASPGVYTGEYTIRRGDNLQNELIVGTLTTASGQTFTTESEEKVTTNTGPVSVPTILTPKEDTQVKSPLVITGTATPNTRVAIRINYSTRVLGALDLTGKIAEQIVNVDSKGQFKSEPINIDTLTTRRGTEYTITVVGLDSKDEESDPAEITVKRS